MPQDPRQHAGCRGQIGGHRDGGVDEHGIGSREFARYEGGVRRYRAVHEQSGVAGRRDGRGDHRPILVAEQPVLAGVGVQPADRDARCGDAELVA